MWKVLTDPQLLARMTPFLKRIDADGDTWVWQMSGLDVLGLKIAPCFTEQMSFTEGSRIEFSHRAPQGQKEWAGVEGWYDLAELDGDGDGGGDRPKTRLRTSMEITVDLPLPKLSGPAVRASMKGVIDQMGNRFSKNLLAQLRG